MEDQEPIYRFEGLKNLLISLGYNVGQAVGYREVENVDVDLNDLRTNMEFTDDGIFLINPDDNSRQQVFLYKRNYRLLEHGKPRFHIRKCQTIQSFIDSGNFRAEYRRANTEKVWVCDMDDDNKDKLIDNLPLCQKCARIALGVSKNMHSSDFVELLHETSEASDNDTRRDLEVDILGYSRDWESISSSYRDSHNNTCEECGIHIEDPFDSHFMHVHHINGNRSDNRTQNLRCLCIRCHSEVNEQHRQNFSKGANRVLLEQFNEKYTR